VAAPTILASGARKAQVAAVIGFLLPLGAFIGSQDQWSWRAFGAALIGAVVSGLSVYATANNPAQGGPGA
jgi:hypothetical protein